MQHVSTVFTLSYFSRASLPLLHLHQPLHSTPLPLPASLRRSSVVWTVPPHEQIARELEEARHNNASKPNAIIRFHSIRRHDDIAEKDPLTYLIHQWSTTGPVSHRQRQFSPHQAHTQCSIATALSRQHDRMCYARF